MGSSFLALLFLVVLVLWRLSPLVFFLLFAMLLAMLFPAGEG